MKADHKWRTVLLEDVATDLTVGFVGPMASEYVSAGIPFLRSQNIEPYRVLLDDVKFIGEQFHQRLSKSTLAPGDVVIVRTGKPGAAAMIPESLPVANCSDLVIVRPGPNLDARFLVYYVNQAGSNHIASHLVGAVQQHFNVGSARQMQIKLPTLAEQKAISSVLGTLDDKIDLNRRMNQTLEAMAQALFKSWFVDFDPVRAKMEGRKPEGMDAETAALFPSEFEESEVGSIPKSWDHTKLHDLISISKTSISPSNTPEQCFQHYSLPAFDEGMMPRRELGSEIMSNKFIVPSKAILLSKLNPHTPRIWFVKPSNDCPAIASTEFLPIIPSGNYWGFAYSVLKSENAITELAGKIRGTSNSHQRINAEDLLSISFVRPSRELISRFCSIIDPVMERTLNNLREIATLAQIRDSLLPKLISGEIRVPLTEGAENG